MNESSRSINHRLNEILTKSKFDLKVNTKSYTDVVDNISKNKLDAPVALNYASILRSNILGKDKQEKVNSIVVLAKLMDCISNSDAVSNDFTKIIDRMLFNTLFSIVSANMSTETYKAIIKISVILISGSIFKPREDALERYLPLLESMIEFLDVVDIITQKLYLQDNKITYNSIKLVTEIINKSLKFNYSGVITLAGRLKHVTFFSTVGNSIETDDISILDAIDNLKVSYSNLNDHLNATKFDMSIKSHQVMLNNLFIYLEISLNEYGTPATPEEYAKAGFTENPRNFVIENLSILLAMDLKIFLKDPNYTFKKRFHEELMMSDHNRTFPLYVYIDKVTDLWLKVFHQREKYPNIYSSILSWELMIYYTMNNCLILWQETKAILDDGDDVLKILNLIESNIDKLELDMSLPGSSIEECLDITGGSSSEEMRHTQATRIKQEYSQRWQHTFSEFNAILKSEILNFVSEQRLIQLLKGSWVYTELGGEALFKSKDRKQATYKYYFILLSPNRKEVCYKEFLEKPLVNPSFEEMQSQSIKLSDIVDFSSTKFGSYVGEEDKKKNNMLITVKGTISYEKITLLGEGGGKLFSFYTDTQVNKFVWLDGLKMLKGMIKPGQLSEDTEKQLNTLVDIRRNTQLVNLEDCSTDNDSASDVSDVYDINELSNITQNFYYT